MRRPGRFAAFQFGAVLIPLSLLAPPCAIVMFLADCSDPAITLLREACFVAIVTPATKQLRKMLADG